MRLTVKQRVAGAYAILCLLVLTLIAALFLVGDKIDEQHLERGALITGTRDANRSLLQHLTDAESGVRGFQLTGDTRFLEPYLSGRAGAAADLTRLDAAATDAELRDLAAEQRAAADAWLYGYAIPVVNAGGDDADALRGKDLFDRLRGVNAEVESAIEDRLTDATAADRREIRLAELGFAGLAVLILAIGLGLALTHQRLMLAPLEHIRNTLRRLTDGDMSARVEPSGATELRAVAASVNGLADHTQRLYAAEDARTFGSDLIQSVAAELKADRDLSTTSEIIAALVGRAFRADTVHARITVARGAGLAVSWPLSSPHLDTEVAREIRAAEHGVAMTPAAAPDGLAVPLAGEADCPPGLFLLVRSGRPEWTAEERRLLTTIGDEIDHAVRQERLRHRQNRLISELRSLDEQKDVFVSTVTHELRTPLTSILGYTEMLVDGDPGDLSPAQERGLNAILRNAHRLQATIADLLLLDRSNEQVGTELVPVDLADVAAGLHRDLGGAARAKRLSSELDAEPAWVRGDSAQLKRAMRYLMENAIKFTPAGGRLECRLTADDRNVVVTISDTGIGIPPGDVPGLFTPFHRAANAMDQAVQGTGLGLAIVRNIVVEHGGTVAAHSELGRGSTFTMTLPALSAAHR